MNNSNICLTTLAMGSKYRKLAQLLAQDASDLCNNTPFIILTDQPKDFVKFKNVIPIQHQIQSVGIYHDKLFALKEGLKHFECSIFLDSDCRLLKNVVESRSWKNGLTVKSCQNLLKFLTRNEREKKVDFNQNKQYRITSYIADKYQINLEDCKYIIEILFVLKKDNLNNYEKFLMLWNEIRLLFESNRIFDGEGITMGLAAHIANVNIYHYDTGYPEEESLQRIDDVYKDKLFYKRNDLSPEISQKVQQFTRERQQIEKQYFWLQKFNKLIEKVKKEKRLQQLKNKYQVIYL